MKCKETAGFLMSHPCTKTAVLTCAACGKDVCEDHSRETDEGYACITCYKQQHVDSDLRSPAGSRRYYRDPYYYGYYHGYYPYAMRDQFDEGDRQAFASDADAGADAVEADADGS